MSANSASSTSTSGRTREFDFSDEDFNSLREIVRRETGIALAESKRELVYGRVSRRLRALNMNSFRDYRNLLNDGSSTQEIVEFCNAITTNLTAFYREAHHFEYLSQQYLKPLAERPGASRRLRFWSAGCSTGEEPYTITMTILETLRDLRGWDIKLLATDIDSDVLRRGQNGVYTEDRLQKMDPGLIRKYFREQRDSNSRSYAVSPECKSLITFKQLNLMHQLPMRGPLDVIFCRNTIIYFDKDTQRELMARIAPLQRPGDLLFLGHSESLFKVSDGYDLIGKTIYRRNDR
jgi:chemotaxis protein methyltransferase CheR